MDSGAIRLTTIYLRRIEMGMPEAPNLRTTDWRYTSWETRRDNHVGTFGGSARIVWCTNPRTDVAYVVPTDDDNGNANALLISLAPDIMKCLMFASTCLNDSESAESVKKFVDNLKGILGVDVKASGPLT
jgi:hypothetical protein